MINLTNTKAGRLALLIALAGLAVSETSANAQTLTNYTAGAGDVLVCFRNTLNNGNDLVVDAGPVANLIAYGHNTTNLVSGFTSNQLAQVAFPLKVNWSVFTWSNDNTLFMSRSRGSLAAQSTPWKSKNSTLQGYVASDLTAIAPGASDNYAPTKYNANSTAAAVIEPDLTFDPNTGTFSSQYPDGESYHTVLDPTENFASTDFGGDFQGSPENTQTNLPARSDFYQLTPGGAVTWLGYFELEANGTLNYVAYPTTMPVIKSFARSGNVSTVTYATGVYGTYTLRSTSNLIGAGNPSTWTAVATLHVGDNNTYSYPDTDTTGTKFYTITSTP
jgi:hypothetical protein